MSDCSPSFSACTIAGEFAFEYAAVTHLRAPDESRASYLHELGLIEPGDTWRRPKCISAAPLAARNWELASFDLTVLGFGVILACVAWRLRAQRHVEATARASARSGG